MYVQALRKFGRHEIVAGISRQRRSRDADRGATGFRRRLPRLGFEDLRVRGSSELTSRNGTYRSHTTHKSYESHYQLRMPRNLLFAPAYPGKIDFRFGALKCFVAI